MSSPDLDYLLNVCTLSPLLTAEQEIMYGKRIQAGIALTDPTSKHYVAKPNAKQRRTIQSGLRAEKAMVNANLRLVINCAKKYANYCSLQHLDFADLVQEGVIGLMRGAQKYDPERGYKFSTYSFWWIRQAVTRAISMQDRAIRLPMGCGDLLSKLNRFIPEYVAQHGRKPNLEEQAAHCGCSEESLKHYLRHTKTLASLDAPAKAMKDEAKSSLVDLIACDCNAFEKLEAELDREIVFRTLQKLSPKEQAVLEHRYEINGAEALTQPAIGQKLGISRERVRQIEERALQRLRGFMRLQPLNFRTVSIPAETYSEQLELEVAA